MYVLLIHWKPEQAQSRIAPLVAAGYKVEVLAPNGGAGLKQISPDVDAILIDLDRLPMHGRAVAMELRKRVATRRIPLVFVAGEPDKVEVVRQLLPDAAYTDWSKVPADVERAVLTAPTSPLVPDTMAGYSGTPLPKKLGIKANTVLALVAAPAGFEALLDPLPDGVRIVNRPPGADRAVLFVRAMRDVEKHWEKVTESVAQGATVWLAWPKKAAGTGTDVTEPAIRAYGLARGWVDYKICAIDATWSGLAFAKRRSPGS